MAIRYPSGNRAQLYSFSNLIAKLPPTPKGTLPRMLRIFDQPPAELWACSADELADKLGGPSLIRLPGRVPQPLFVSTLLHGNETTGWDAVRRHARQWRRADTASRVDPVYRQRARRARRIASPRRRTGLQPHLARRYGSRARAGRVKCLRKSNANGP